MDMYDGTGTIKQTGHHDWSVTTIINRWVLCSYVLATKKHKQQLHQGKQENKRSITDYGTQQGLQTSTRASRDK